MVQCLGRFRSYLETNITANGVSQHNSVICRALDKMYIQKVQYLSIINKEL